MGKNQVADEQTAMAGAGGGKPLQEKLNDLKLTEVWLDAEVNDGDWKYNEECEKIEGDIWKPALYDQIALIVPRYPLYKVENEERDTSTAIHRMTHDWTRWVQLFFNWLNITAYPFAAFLKEFIRFLGYILYYFWVIPTRFVGVMILQPFLDGIYRLLRPCYIFGNVLTKPLVVLLKDSSSALYPACAGYTTMRSGGDTKKQESALGKNKLYIILFVFVLLLFMR